MFLRLRTRWSSVGSCQLSGWWTKPQRVTPTWWAGFWIPTWNVSVFTVLLVRGEKKTFPKQTSNWVHFIFLAEVYQHFSCWGLGWCGKSPHFVCLGETDKRIMLADRRWASWGDRVRGEHFEMKSIYLYTGAWYLCGSHKCVTKRYRQTQFTNGQNTQFVNLLKLFSAQPPFFILEQKGTHMVLCFASIRISLSCYVTSMLVTSVRDGNGHRHTKSMQTFTAGFLSQYSPLPEDTGNWVQLVSQL